MIQTHKKIGFTLVELIVVITILAILATIAFISLQGYARSARESIRVSDMSTIAKSLELFRTSNSYYPDPSNTFQVTYTGALAWNQGVFGESTRSLVQRISQVPTDPLTKNPYAYSLTNTRQEYELGAIRETLLASHFQNNQSYAANSYYSNIKGNYNKKIVSVRTAGNIYILGVPTIITSEINNVTVENILTNQSFAVRNSQNLPASYANTLPNAQTHTGSISSFLPGVISGTSAPLLYQGTLEDLSTPGGKVLLGDNIIKYYKTSNIAQQSEYSDITVNNINTIVYVNTLISGNIAGLQGITLSENTSLGIPIPSTYFVSSWNTSNTGSSNSNQIRLPLHSSGTYNFFVDWGDGTSDTITAHNQAAVTHTYASSGIYTVKINGTLIGFSFQASSPDNLKLINISQWGNIKLEPYIGNQFLNTKNMIVTATDTLDTSNVINADSMFAGATIFNGNISTWNTSNITNMRQMFNNADAFNQNIGSWNTANVQNMESMFAGTNIFNGNIGSWNTANVTTMRSMFRDADGFNQNIGSWNTGNVTDMYWMFQGTALFNQNIGSWNTSKVTTMNYMFGGNLVFNQNIGSWNTSNVTDMSTMFGSSIFNQNIGSWNTSKVTNMSNMFIFNDYFNQDIGNWDTSKVTNMATMFHSSDSFSQNLSCWDVTLIHTTPTFFSVGSALTGGQLPVWGTSGC